MTRTSLITGISGQDGIYLGRLLLAEGRRVVGTTPPSSTRAARVATYLPGAEVAEVDLRDTAAMAELLARTGADEVYNLAALTSVGRSWQDPATASAVNADAVGGLLQALVEHRDRSGSDVRFLQASSAEVRAAASDSPYARAKAAAETMVREARERHGLHAGIAILSNHESPLRPEQFVSRKITRAAAEIALGRREQLTLGNLEVSRDWGFAGDHVDAVRRMLRLDEPAELAIGTGTPRSLGDLVKLAFAAADVADPWSYVTQDPDLVRPVDAKLIVADPEPAAEALGWRATTSFEQLVAHMVAVDLARLRTGVEDDPAYLFTSA